MKSVRKIMILDKGKLESNLLGDSGVTVGIGVGGDLKFKRKVYLKDT